MDSSVADTNPYAHNIIDSSVADMDHYLRTAVNLPDPHTCDLHESLMIMTECVWLELSICKRKSTLAFTFKAGSSKHIDYIILILSSFYEKLDFWPERPRFTAVDKAYMYISCMHLCMYVFVHV